MTTDRVTRTALWLAFGASAVLLARFAWDFSVAFPALALPFCALVAGALWLAVANLRSPKSGGGAPGAVGYALLALVPLAFLASSLGCTGLALEGCSPFCTFVKLVWVPLVAVACAVYAATRRAAALAAVAAMAVVPLAPHCVCYNAANAWWIDTIGRSPVCYAWGTAVTVVALSSVRSGARRLASQAACGAVVCGALAFFVGHHYFQFPW
jgi:hypothetical protein